jgi:hypothetical protein
MSGILNIDRKWRVHAGVSAVSPVRQARHSSAWLTGRGCPQESRRGHAICGASGGSGVVQPGVTGRPVRGQVRSHGERSPARCCFLFAIDAVLDPDPATVSGDRRCSSSARCFQIRHGVLKIASRPARPVTCAPKARSVAAADRHQAMSDRRACDLVSDQLAKLCTSKSGHIGELACRPCDVTLCRGRAGLSAHR